MRLSSLFAGALLPTVIGCSSAPAPGGGPGGATSFPSSAVFYQDVSHANVDGESAMIMAALQAAGWGGRLGIDSSFTVYDLDASVARRTFVQPPDAIPDCDTAQVPVPVGGHIEGETNLECVSGGDCHLLAYQGARLYELYQASITGGQATGGTFSGGCLVVWDLGHDYWPADGAVGPGYSRGDGCNGADAGDLPMAPLILKSDEIRAGVVKHALRFTLLNSKIRKGVYVHPDTHLGGPSGGPDTLPYGSRLRLKASFDDSGLSAQGRMVTAALKKYGMFLADGGNIFISASDDIGDVMDTGALRSLEPQDFEMIDAGPRIDINQESCSRTVVSN